MAQMIVLATIVVTAALGGASVLFYFIGLNNASCTSATPQPVASSHQSTQNVTTVEDGRLPRHIEPLLYKIQLFPHMYGTDRSTFNFTGSVWLKFRCLEKSKNITLNSNKIDLKDIRVGYMTATGESGSKITILKYELIEKWQFLLIHLEEYLEVGDEYYINIDFSGPLKTDFAGLYLSTFPYRTSNQYVAATQFSPTDARKAFPCLDESDRKAQFEISLVRRMDMISLSNMPRISSTPTENDFLIDVFERTPKMPTYLLAMAIGDLNSITREARKGLNYTSWAGRESIDKTKHGLQFGAEVLSVFENYFGITFPLPKQDMLAVPETSVGAMENWGLIIFNQNRIFYQKGEYSHNSLLQSTITISHELVHQWFGNLVSMNWWSDLFLKEGFAVYFSDVGIAKVHPDWNFMDHFAMRNMHSVFDADGLVSSHPVYKTLRDATEIRQVFDSISYTKGGCMIRLLNFILGDSDFQTGLKRYLQQFQYDSVGHNQLWEALEPKHHPPGVKQVMDTWILQKNYPVITVSQIKPRVLRIKQERFLNNPAESANDTETSPFHYIWKIPLTYTASDRAKFSVSYEDIIWMEDKELIIVDRQLLDLSRPGNWVIANLKQWGYYRVNYDPIIWNNLIEQLNSNKSHIDLVNRAQLINDIFSLSKAGFVPLKTALNVFEYLRFEDEYVPWLAAIKEIKYISDRLQNSKMHEDFKLVVNFLVNTTFTKLEVNRNTLSMEQNLLRTSVFDLACSFGMKTCIEISEQTFKEWKTKGTKLDPDIRSTILCSALKKGSLEDWNYVLQNYNTTLNINEKYAYLSALACTEEDTIQQRLLYLTGDPFTIQSRDIGNTLMWLAKNSRAKDKVWEHVVQNWQKFLDIFSGSLFLLSNLVEGVTAPFSTTEQLQSLEEFVGTAKDLGPAKQTFMQAIEGTKNNIAWLTKHQTTIEEWISNTAKKFYI